MNQHVEVIMFREQKINKFKRTVPILGQRPPRSDGKNVLFKSANWISDLLIELHNYGNELKPIKENDRRGILTTKVRKSKEVTLQPLLQTKTMIVTDSAGLFFIKLCGEVPERYTLRASNGVAEVERYLLFSIILSDFRQQERKLPKRTVFVLAFKHPIALPGELGY